jgi:thiol-disulfide isomerase/thioredoxin
LDRDASYNEVVLLRKLAEGDESAFSQLFEYHSKAIYATSLHFLKDAFQAEEVVQEIFMRLLSALNMEQQEQAYALLSERIKKSPEGKRFSDHIQGVKNGVVGNTVTNFTLNDPSGTKIDLASFKGKYVLIDFWASWCSPCRKSFPYMRKLYGAYKSPSFEMYSISIDKKKADWLKAVGQENNPWPQSLDTIDISAAGFGVAGIPTAVLIDPQGKIVARETGIATDGTDGIEKKLAELFGKKM